MDVHICGCGVGRATHPTVPVCTLLPSGIVISGNLAPIVAEFRAARSGFAPLEAMSGVCLVGGLGYA